MPACAYAQEAHHPSRRVRFPHDQLGRSRITEIIQLLNVYKLNTGTGSGECLVA
jgi:hypothetical protein